MEPTPHEAERPQIANSGAVTANTCCPCSGTAPHTTIIPADIDLRITPSELHSKHGGSCLGRTIRSPSFPIPDKTGPPILEPSLSEEHRHWNIMSRS
jgi:hypothetical protein